MKPHSCPNCATLLHFECRVCDNCGATLGYDPESDRFLFLGHNATAWLDGQGERHGVVVCRNNNEFAVCNWLVPESGAEPLCRACRHNRTIPDLNGPNVPERWGKIEAAKRRLFQTLLVLGLPIETEEEAEANGTEPGLKFDFLYDPEGERTGTLKITTGHEDGLITLNLVEADDIQREKMRVALGEPYRTLLGHFRHEIGHYYWSRLVERSAALEPFRLLFGDERISYEDAMKEHYDGAGTGQWSAEHVSAYAKMHPWEDFAETFAHLLHIIDTLATIQGFGIEMTDWNGQRTVPTAEFNPYDSDIATLIAKWVPFAFAQNSINRAMGHSDLYPFQLTDPVIAKLSFINDLLSQARHQSGPPAQDAPAETAVDERVG